MSAKATAVPSGKLALLRGPGGRAVLNLAVINELILDLKGLFQIAN
jgi:hypothetical protein